MIFPVLFSVHVFLHYFSRVCLRPTIINVFFRADDSPTDDRCRRRSRLLSEGEVVLLESVAHHGKRLPNGRFLTMHKRRRKKLTTRSLSNDTAPALLDDIHHGQVRVSGYFLYFYICKYRRY